MGGRRWGVVVASIVLALCARHASAQTNVSEASRGLFTERVVIGGTTFGATSPLQVIGLPAKTSETACAWLDASGNVYTGACPVGDITGVSFTLPGLFNVVSPCTSGDCSFTFVLADTTANWVFARSTGTGPPSMQAMTKAMTPSTTVHTDQVNTFGAFTQTMNGLLNADGGINVDTSNFSVSGTTGAITTGSTVQASGLASLNGGIAVDTSNFTVDGSTGAVVTASTLQVGSTSTLSGLTNANGGIAVDTTNFTVSGTTGAVSTASTLGVTGATTLSSTLDVRGTISDGGDTQIDIADNINVTGGVTTSGDVTVNGGDITSSAAILNLDAGGTVNVVDKVTFAGNIGSSLIPTATDTYNLGSYSFYWNEGFISQLNAVLFAEATATLFGGYSIISPNAGVFNTAVAAGGPTTAIDFGRAMTTGHFVEVRALDTAGATRSEFMQVGALVSGTTYTTSRGLNNSNVGYAFAEGTPYAVNGTTGNGRIELNAYTSPKITIFEQGAAYGTKTTRAKLGDLNGDYGYVASTFGFGAGVYTGNAVTVDSTNGLRFLDNGTVKASFSSTGLALGQTTGTEENIAITAAGGVKFLNGTTEYGSLNGSLWRLGADADEHLEIDATSLRFENAGGTAWASLAGSTFTLGDTAGEHVVIDTALRFKVAATEYASLNGTTWTFGSGATDSAQLSISPSLFAMQQNKSGVWTNMLRLGQDGTSSYMELGPGGASNTYALMRPTSLVFKGNNVDRIVLNGDGSGALAGGNITWDTAGNTTFTGSITSGSTITGATVRTEANCGASAGNCVLMDSTSLRWYDGSNLLKGTIDGNRGVKVASSYFSDIYDEEGNYEFTGPSGSLGLFGMTAFENATHTVKHVRITARNAYATGAATKGAYLDITAEGTNTSNATDAQTSGGARISLFSGGPSATQTITMVAGSSINMDSNTLFVDASTNRVGVGTASPSYPLHVAGQTYITTQLGVGIAPNSGVGVYSNSALQYGTLSQTTRATGDSYGVYGSATGAGTTNYGVYGAASGATTNWGVYSADSVKAVGNVFSAGLYLTNWTGAAALNTACSDHGGGSTGYLLKCTSSRRYKHDILPLAIDWARILDVQPVSYVWNGRDDAGAQLGVIAEEMADLGLDWLVDRNEQGQPDGVRYEKMALYLIPVVRDQREQLAAQQQQIDALMQRLEALERR